MVELDFAAQPSGSMALGRSAMLGDVSMISKNSSIFGACMNKVLKKPTTCSSRAISMVAKFM